jgi:hypothetical protein
MPDARYKISDPTTKKEGGFLLFFPFFVVKNFTKFKNILNFE